jgi:ATP-binding cassette subfamily B protein RaxB
VPSVTLAHAAAARASVHNDIAAMPMHYLSLVGDMGAELSGGQRQSVLLDRVVRVEGGKVVAA